MIDFEKIRHEVLAELKENPQLKEKTEGERKFILDLNEQIIFVCCKALMKYHVAMQKENPPADH